MQACRRTARNAKGSLVGVGWRSFLFRAPHHLQAISTRAAMLHRLTEWLFPGPRATMSAAGVERNLEAGLSGLDDKAGDEAFVEEKVEHDDEKLTVSAPQRLRERSTAKPKRFKRGTLLSQQRTHANLPHPSLRPSL